MAARDADLAGGNSGLPSARVTPIEAATLIKFALSQLSADNGFHDFEHLCRHLTRRKICPNIVPSTGPVAGGGDQGADFETYKVADFGKHDLHSTDFFARAVEEKWLFACSLEQNYKKKIRTDLSAAKTFGEVVDRLVFFHHLSIKTSDRHKLQSEAREKYGLELEIFDGPAIAEMLADHQSAWIAQRFLSIPSEFVLQPEGQSPDWFEAVLATTYDSEYLTSAEFFKLKDAVRFVTWRSEYHSNLAKLLKDLRIFKNHPFYGIGRRAIYEEFVASLRGLETTAGLESSLREYFSDIESLVGTAELEDAAVLLGYTLGAKVRGLLSLPLEELRRWHTRLWDCVQKLKQESSSDGRQCALLFVEGSLAFSRFNTTADDATLDRDLEFRQGARAAVAVWRKLAKQAADTPLFPIERLASGVRQTD
jgi:hypothetical protein